MGQYYKIVNVDKEEILVPWRFDNGAKLMEWAYEKNPMVLAMLNLLATTWKGDHVYVVGDYADFSDSNECWYKPLKAIFYEKGIRNLYSYSTEHFRDISEYTDREHNCYQYIYNHTLKVYIDLNKCPIENACSFGRYSFITFTKISPLPLLLAMGNGRGGGDFMNGCNGFEHVGTWCNTVQSIELSKSVLPVNGYTEFQPNFTEKQPLIPYDAIKTYEDLEDFQERGIFIKRK